MNINNPKEIAKKIEATGFPLEIEVFNKLSSFGFFVGPSAKYIDEELGKSRELDIEAGETYGHDKDIGKGGFLMSHFIIQCKRLSKAWIFFDNSQIKELIPKDELFNTCICENLNFPLFLKKVGADSEMHSLFKGVQGTGKIHKSFLEIPRAKDDGLYEAIVTTVKAKRYFKNLYSDEQYLGNNLIRIFWPIIVTDRIVLWSASLEDRGAETLSDKNLKKVKLVILSFEYLKRAHDWEGNKVFIVSNDHLNDFLKKTVEINKFLYTKWDSFCKSGKL